MTNAILALVAERSGMVFAANRLVEAEAGIARCMKRAGAHDRAAYLALLRRDPAALDQLLDGLAVGETHFMRDPEQMDLIRRDVLPALRRRRAMDGHAPRVWSAGCATGEEAHTLAILLEEEGLAKGAVILGTDLSAAALDKARAGSYSDWSMRGVSDAFLNNYFRHVRGRRILAGRIRNQVRFERLNLVGPEDYASVGAVRMDLILCRNVLIYFDHETAGRIAARLYECLAEGGALLTAGADLLIGEYAPFEVDVTRAGLVYRRPRTGSRRQPAAANPTPVASSAARTEPVEVPEPRAPAALPPDAAPGREAFEQVSLVANGIGAFEAEVMAHAALRRHPLDAPLHYLRATLLLALGRDPEAEREARRALYLDPTLAIAHFLLGTMLRARGVAGAVRAFRNARDLCAGRPPDETLPAGSGERVAALHSAASDELRRLEVAVG